MQNIKNISFEKVTFDGGFWKFRYDLNRNVSLQNVYLRFEETGRFDALRFNYEKSKTAFPDIFFDSDVAKWIEAVSYLIQKNGGLIKEQLVIDELVCEMEKHQLECGYMNSHFIQVNPNGIFKDRTAHELYCAGHLLEAAIAYDKATGKSAFLNVMKKYVDYIEKAFVVEKTAAFKTGGHEEIELALLKLYDYDGDARYLDLAIFFLNERGEKLEPCHVDFNEKYDQRNAPVRELEKAEGHAVRAVYLYTAMCEAYLKTGDIRLLKACKRLFDDVIYRKLYITGGIGSSAHGEAFTVAYDLPNLEAYTESCAALGLELFALSMQQTALDHRFGDVIERIMYNNMLSSTSIDGKAFFYENPLEIHLADVNKATATCAEKQVHLPLRHRLEVFECSCCPPNVNRIFARMGDFFFSETENALIINQYAHLTLQNEKIVLRSVTDYPVSGRINLTIERCDYEKILLRKPEWCDSFSVDGADFTERDGYIEINVASREFSIDFHMEPYFAEANPQIRADNGRVALLYGPTVYCLEALDNPYPLNALCVNTEESLTKTFDPAYPMPNFKATGTLDAPFDGLYRKVQRQTAPVQLSFRPYWTFVNRAECDMLVWVRLK